MIRHRITLPRPHVRRPEPALEMAMALIVMIAVLAVGALGWSALTGRSLSPVSWYIARGSGFALYLLSWFLVVSGLGMTTKLLATTGNRAVSLSLHAFAFHLWYGLLALHVLSIAVDPAVRFGLVELVVPFASGWREPWTGLGIVAAQLGILAGASAAVRRVLGYRAWKALHWLSLPMFGLGLLHGLLAGTDGGTLAAFVLYVVTGGWVVMLGTYRVLRRHARDEQRAIRQRQAVLARGHGSRRPMCDA
jgi:methionine sulfoxide reductase heme-binding subunit